MNTDPLYQAIVMGVSAGGIAALKAILPRLPETMCQPVIIVQHMSPDADDFLVQYFDKQCNLRVKEAEDKMPIKSRTIYFAPANYHLLVEEDKTFGLSTAERVQFSRPAIDVLFDTAAETFRDRLMGVILTGANSDGTSGIRTIRAFGGYAVAQSPETAEAPAMPGSAIDAGVDMVLDLEKIAPFINQMMSKGFKQAK